MPTPSISSILESCNQLDYLPLFEENEINIDQLPELSMEDLKEIGIEKLGHRKSILAAIQATFAEAAKVASHSELSELNSEPPVAVDVPFEIVGKPKVFLSYGRKDALEVAQRLECDLVAAGYEVWMDVKKIGSGSQWQQEIEEGLRQSHVVVSLLSPHAVRKVGEDVMDSVCLDELTFARTSSPPTPVVPAMVVPCEPPFIIYRLDYVHLTGWKDSDESYRLGFERLISGIRDALSGKVRYRLWEDRLRPLDFSDYLAQKRRGFVGREWLFEEIDLWRFHSEERALLITGDPGAGKSSIVAQLAHLNPDGQVIAYHCCQSNELETLRPAKFVQSLAAMIASRLPAYAEQLEVPIVKEALEDNRCDDDAGGAFLVGILQPLQKLAAPDDGVRYILVDALDEALCHTGTNTIVDILASRLERLPSWLRIVATTRNEPGVIQRLSGLRAKSIDATDPRNLNDVATYIRQRLDEPALAERRVESRKSVDAIVRLISQNSSGNFLYAANALDGIARDFYSFAHLDALPRGLDGIYLDFFRRIFGHEGSEAGEVAYKRAKPFLQVLCASVEPLSRKELATASNLDPEEDLPQLLRRLAQLLSRRSRGNREETIAFYHKSVADWLVGNPDVNAFAVSPAKGRKLLADFCRATLSQGRAKPCWYVRRHAVEHFLEVEDWDSVAATLSDLEFIEARAITHELPAMIMNYAQAMSLLPEGKKEQQTEAARQAELDRYAEEMAEYAAIWSRIRDGSVEVEPTLPQPVGSVPLWTEEQIAAERKRMIEMPNRLDIINAFRVFVATNSLPLQKYSNQEGFAANLARNDAPAGPVHEEGKRRLEALPRIKLIKQFVPSNTYNPQPVCQAILEGHIDGVKSVSLSADGRRAVSGSLDGALRVWDLETGECLKVLEGHAGPVISVALHADGRRAVSGSGDGTLRIWHLGTGECLKVLEGHRGIVSTVALSADGRRAVSGSHDKTVRVWDLRADKCMKILEGHTDTVETVSLSADGSRVVSGSWDCSLRVWDIETGECIKVLVGHMARVDSVIQAADGRQAVSASSDSTLRVWNVDAGECLLVLEGHTDYINSVSLSADGRRAVSGSWDKTLRVWCLETGECLKVLEGHMGVVESVSLSIDGRRVVSGGDDKTVRVWDLEACESPNIIEGHVDTVESIIISANGGLGVSGSWDRTLRVWDLKTGKCLKLLEGHMDVVVSLAISADGRRAASGSTDNTLRIWDLQTSECLKVLNVKMSLDALVVLSANGRRLVSVHDETELHWNFETGEFNPQGGHILRVWDLKTGECFKLLEGHTNAVVSLALSADGRRVVSGSRDKTLRVWCLETGECLKVLKGHIDAVLSLALSADGRRVVSGSRDKTLRVWCLETGECLKVLEGHIDAIMSIALSADGRRVVSGSRDETLRVWCLETGECLKVLEGHIHIVVSVALSADGRYAISSSRDKVVRVWNLETGECLAVYFKRGISIARFNSISQMVIGCSNGSVEFYDIENLALGPFITTANREIISEDLPAGPITARPPCCGQLVSIPDNFADRIEHWTYEYGAGGYTDPALLLDCPSCGTPLRLNPFFLDVKTNTTS
jgi:WD40 repeat protein